MSLDPGVRLGPYAIEAPLGRGGMGEVYRARDMRLDRAVALKLLPAAFASDPERLARFEREAKLLASLNHPNIAQVYGFEGVRLPDGAPAHLLAMELVEGEDLAERLTRGALPLDEALAVARQVAEAIEAAHEKGIVHRDLKPANVRRAPDGKVKVLDFGLAKAQSGDGSAGPPAASHVETQAAPLTRAGAVFGTPAYMAPEQARGQAVDKRADVWAFGCLLFELLAGRRPFDGRTSTDALAAILLSEPDWALLPATTPTALRRLLRRCLEKDPKRRQRDIGDARIELDEAAGAGATEPLAAKGAGHERAYRAATGVLAGALLLAIAWATLARRPAPTAAPAAVTRTTIVLPADHTLHSGDSSYSLALSPDGTRLAYIGENELGTALYLRRLDGLDSKPLAGTAGATQPFFSPDGEWIGYFASGALQKVAVTGGAPVRICAVPALSRGASWGRDGRIAFALRGSGLHVVDAAGGAPRALAHTENARWPEVLPDGRTLVFTRNDSITLMPLDGGAQRLVAKTSESSVDAPALLGTGVLAQARYLPSGHLAYGQSPGILRVAPFDLASGRITGPVTSVAASLERARNNGAVYFTVAASGLLVYATTGSRHQLVWVDRAGNATPISADREAFRVPRVSPDGRRVAVGANDQQTRRSDAWVYDAQSGTRRRLTTERHNGWPLWTPDGKMLTVASTGSLYEMPADGDGKLQLLLESADLKARYPCAWSPDGRELVHLVDGPAGMDLAVLRRGGETRALLDGPFNEEDGALSPDGQVLAYASDESGRLEVYVARYPGLENRTAISTDGGHQPVWSRRGGELFFRQGDAVMAAVVETRGTLRAERPRRLFAGAYSSEGRSGQFDVAPDGRFAMVADDPTSVLRALTVVQGWFSELAKAQAGTSAP